MKGHIHKRGSRWAWVVDAGRDPATGKRRQKTKGGFETKASAERALREFLVEFESGTYVAPASTLTAEYLQEWLPTIATRVRPTTLSGGGTRLRPLCAFAGRCRPVTVNRAEVEAIGLVA